MESITLAVAVVAFLGHAVAPQHGAVTQELFDNSREFREFWNEQSSGELSVDVRVIPEPVIVPGTAEQYGCSEPISSEGLVWCFGSELHISLSETFGAIAEQMGPEEIPVFVVRAMGVRGYQYWLRRFSTWRPFFIVDEHYLSSMIIASGDLSPHLDSRWLPAYAWPAGKLDRYFPLQVFQHELGHVLGLGHVNLLSCTNSLTTPDVSTDFPVLSQSVAPCSESEYGGGTLMGEYSVAHKILEVQKKRLGWVKPEEELVMRGAPRMQLVQLGVRGYRLAILDVASFDWVFGFEWLDCSSEESGDTCGGVANRWRRGRTFLADHPLHANGARFWEQTIESLGFGRKGTFGFPPKPELDAKPGDIVGNSLIDLSARLLRISDDGKTGTYLFDKFGSFN